MNNRLLCSVMRVFVLLHLVATCTVLAGAAPAGDVGEIEGFVANATDGDALANARVVIAGTHPQREATTDAEGRFRFTDVPAGEVTLDVSHIGMAGQTQKVTVIAGRTASQNFEIGVAETSGGGGGPARPEEIVLLDRYSVQAGAMNALSIALAEQKNADNIKNVITPEEFADMGDGNLGEFLKFMPGVDMDYDANRPKSVFVRGMPPSTTLVQIDGMTTGAAPEGNTRAVDFSTISVINVDHIEVSKTPTPDMPANDIGGLVNIVSKSGFSRRTPVFDYSVFLTYNGFLDDMNPALHSYAGPDSRATRKPVQLGYNLGYILPIKNKVAFTFNYARNPRYIQSEDFHTNWAPIRNVLTTAMHTDHITFFDTQVVKAGFDWKAGRRGTLQLGYQYTDREETDRTISTQFRPEKSNGTKVIGGEDWLQGAAKEGEINQRGTAFNKYNKTHLLSAKYKYEGEVWTIDAHVSRSWGSTKRLDMSDGLFSQTWINLSNVTISATGLGGVDDRKFPVYTVLNSKGEPVNPYEARSYRIDSVKSDEARYKNEVDGAGINLARRFSIAGVPFRLKTGALVERMTRDQRKYNREWVIRNWGAATQGLNVGDYDLLAREYSRRATFADTAGNNIQGMYTSVPKFYNLYLLHENWFRLSEGAERARINASTELEETITSGYVRLDNRLLEGRLRLVYGVRYELTQDSGSGRLGMPGGPDVLPLERARHKSTHYDGFYPSINIAYTALENLIIRAAFSRNIGRPDLSNIIPSMSITQTSSTDSSNTKGNIALVDGNLKPWTSNNIDLSVELYEYKGATITLGVFYKDIKNFFKTKKRRIRADEAAEFGLPDDYQDYTLVQTINGGNARNAGAELSFRQNLWFIPYVGKNINIFGNVTGINVDGADKGEITGFSKNNYTLGLQYAQSRFNLKVNFSHRDWRTHEELPVSATYAAGSYDEFAPENRVDVSVQFRIWKSLQLFCSVRNLTSESRKLCVNNKGVDVPEYARLRYYEYYPAAWTMGVKGRF